MTIKTKNLLSKAYRSPQYAGKHIVVIGNQIHAETSGQAKSRLLGKLIKKYPKETPIVAYIPKEDSLILIV